MNKRMLQSKMKLFGDTNKSLALYLSLSASRFSAKMNNYHGADFTQIEMNKIKKKYNLTNLEFLNIFFADMVS